MYLFPDLQQRLLHIIYVNVHKCMDEPKSKLIKKLLKFSLLYKCYLLILFTIAKPVSFTLRWATFLVQLLSVNAEQFLEKKTWLIISGGNLNVEMLRWYSPASGNPISPSLATKLYPVGKQSPAQVKVYHRSSLSGQCNQTGWLGTNACWKIGWHSTTVCD